MDIFNNREIAVLLWGIIILSYLLQKKEIRILTKHFLTKFLAAKSILIIIFLIIVYVSLITFFLYTIDLWNPQQLKNTIFWSISFAILSLFNIHEIKEDYNFFKRALLDNLKLLTVIQFIVNIYTFPLWAEILLFPILTFASLIMASTNQQQIEVKKLLEKVFILFGFFIIFYTIYMLISSFEKFYSKDTFDDFLTPILLTALYLPFFFVILLYITYESIFTRLQIFIKKRYLRNLAKIYLCIIFNVRLKLTNRWFEHIRYNPISTHRDLINSFKNTIKLYSAEKTPKDIPSKLGWSPYKAKNFIPNLKTVPYENLTGDLWASTFVIKILNKTNPNFITYSIEGSEEVANTLRLNIGIYNYPESSYDLNCFIKSANNLIQASLKCPLSTEMLKNIVTKNSHEEIHGNKKISLIVEKWVTPSKTQEIELTFTIIVV